MTSPDVQPRRPFKVYLGGLATMAFVFGLATFITGQQDPWGTRQIVGLTLAIAGITMLAVAKFVLK